MKIFWFFHSHLALVKDFKTFALRKILAIGFTILFFYKFIIINIKYETLNSSVDIFQDPNYLAEVQNS